MNLTGTRPWIIGGAVVAAVLVALTWLLVVGPTRSDAQTLRDDTASVQAQNDVLASRAATLRTAAEGRTALEDGVREALAEMPADVDLPGFNQQLTQHAAARGIQIVSVSVGAAVAPASTTAASGGEADPAGILSVPVTVQTKGARLAQLYFLRDLQEVGPRAALVDSTSLTADGDDGGSATDVTDATDDSTTTSMTIQLSIFSHALSAADAEDLAGVVGRPDQG